MAHKRSNLPLLNADCVLEICSYLLDNRPTGRDDTSNHACLATKYYPARPVWHVGRENHRDLISFALTCKTFMDPALDVVWTEIDGLVRSLNVLPSTAFRKVDREEYIFTDPSPESWDRFDLYAGKVRRINFTGDELDLAICGRVAQLHPESLFPNLHRFISARRRDLSPTILLMAPWLQQMPLLNIPDVRAYLSLDASLTPKGVELTAIGFGWVFYAPENDTGPRIIAPPGSIRYKKTTIMNRGFAAFLPAVCSLDLTGCAGGYHIEDLRVLASLSCLTDLKVWIDGPGWPELVAAPYPIFPPLRTLEVRDGPRALLSQFLRRIDSRGLTSLTISHQYHDQRERSALTQPALEIASRKWSTTLRTLFLDCADSTVNAQGHASLAKLKCVEHLRFGSFQRVNFTDAHFLAAIQPLRNLVSFSAVAWRGLTVEALRHVADHLPRLRELDITFLTPTAPPNLPAVPSTHTLDTLIVNAMIGEPWIQNIEATVCHLHHIFPSLRTIVIPQTSNRKWDYELSLQWERVEELLREGCPVCA
ncbi:hypothetical protein C8R46DRAFT_1223476 [Mycena filopes]|nr:hypothetical protein C8R46DRAFT_1223476 [Mycena filopes]